ncbi:MAG: hypothetical protein RL732_1321 [Bacteroidota bacterium]
MVPMKNFLPLLVFLFFCAPAKSQDRRSSNLPSENTLLWEVSGKGLGAPTYLYGTMHVLCEDDAWISEQLKEAISSSKYIYFEVDMDDMLQMLGAVKYLNMRDGVTLSDLLTQHEYDRVQEYFKNRKGLLPFSMMTRFKPFLLAAMISEQSMDCERTNGMEQLIMKQAKRYGKSVKGLETMAFQAGLFDSIPYAVQARELLNYIDSADQYAGQTKSLVEAYRKQDLVQLEELMRVADPGMDAYMDLLVYDRNKRWVDLLQEKMADAPLLVAVGAGHLPGKKGLIQLLRDKGYTVNPLPNTTILAAFNDQELISTAPIR